MAGKLLAYLRQQWIGALALFLVLTGGTAYALDGSNTVFSDDIVNGEVRGTDIANGQVTADDLATNSVRADEVADGQVRSLEIGNGQVQAEDLAPGVAPGASGARAWGLVTSSGTLLRGKQVTAVTHTPESGVYCIDPASGIDPTTAVMVVGEEIALSNTNTEGDDVSHVEWASNAANCPAGTMEVRTFVVDGTAGTFGETDFGGIQLFQFDQGFTFVIL